jgi:hypothetical protein
MQLEIHVFVNRCYLKHFLSSTLLGLRGVRIHVFAVSDLRKTLDDNAKQNCERNSKTNVEHVVNIEIFIHHKVIALLSEIWILILNIILYVGST